MKSSTNTASILLLFLLLCLSSLSFASSCRFSIPNSTDSLEACIDDNNQAILNVAMCNLLNQYGLQSSFSTSSCASEGITCQLNQDPLTIAYYNTNIFNQQSCQSANGTYYESNTITANTPSITAPVKISNSSGSIYTATTSTVAAIGETTPAASALFTQNASQTTITEDDGSQFTAKSNTLVTLHPITQENANEQKKITLLRGTIETNIPSFQREYSIVTPLATLIIKPSVANRATGNSTQFSTTYDQQGTAGSLNVSVSSGTVTVVKRDGTSETVTGGNEIIITDAVPRSNWVLPIDGDYLEGGKNNMLSWVEYPDAAGYKLEYNFPTPNFAEANPSKVEFSNTTILFTQYQLFEGLVVLNLDIPDLKGQVVEARIFPVDSAGNEISSSVGSDTGTFTFK